MNSTLRRAALLVHQQISGRMILERLEEINRTQWLGREELLAIQREKLQRLLEYAYEYVPYYRRTFDQAGFHPQDPRKDPDCLSRLPILTKATIRENFQDLLTTEPERRRRLSKLSTSGSTGQPLVFMQDPDFRDYATASVQHHMSWAGWKLGDLHAIMWGAPLKSSLARKTRTTLLNWVWNRFQIDAFNLTDQSLAAFTKRVARQKPRLLFGYATSIYTFAQFVRQKPDQQIRFTGVFTTSESLLPPVRQFIEETFQCNVYNRYGSVELGGIACECAKHTGYHISPENHYIEIINNGRPALPGEVGEIIVTNLNNRGMPFIRYSIGDAGAWYSGEDCPCGRTSPMLASIEGDLQAPLLNVWRTQQSNNFRWYKKPWIKWSFAWFRRGLFPQPHWMRFHRQSGLSMGMMWRWILNFQMKSLLCHPVNINTRCLN
jgi:phenylacetate-CoA ligase